MKREFKEKLMIGFHPRIKKEMEKQFLIKSLVIEKEELIISNC